MNTNKKIEIYDIDNNLIKDGDFVVFRVGKLNGKWTDEHLAQICEQGGEFLFKDWIGSIKPINVGYIKLVK